MSTTFPKSLTTVTHVTFPDDEQEQGTRVLHLGLVVRDRATLPDVPAIPPTYGVCYGGGEAYLGADADSFRVWGNTEDPDEDHTEDGTRHIVVTVEADKFGTWTEDELGRYLHRRLRHYLDDLPSGWRAADYVVWSDDQHSENQLTIVCA